MTGRRTLEYPSTPSAEVPDHLRCRKNDGKQWRCPMPSLPNITICHYHNEQQRRNYHNRQKNQKHHVPIDDDSNDDDDDDVVLALAVKGDDEMRELPNGVMTISPAPARVVDGSVVDRKVGAEKQVIWGRSVRSKNVEPVPVGPVKRFPIGDKSLVKRKRRRSCHQCGEKNVTKDDHCRKCKSVYFCSSCLSKWYQQISESEAESAKTACPVCCGFCNCETCLLDGAKDRSSKDTCCTEDTVSKMQHPDTPGPQQLSEQEQIIQNELNELELEALDQGRRSSCIQLQVAERAIVNCNHCKTLLAGFHRSCSKCSYKLCLDCSGKFRNGHLPVLVENGKSSEATKACKNYGKETGAKQDDTGRSSIACPTKKLGGCSDGFLRLMFMMPFGRSTELNNREEGFV